MVGTKRQNKKMFLYILQLKYSKWYVGTTSRSLEERFSEHARGEGSSWTKVFPPVAIHDYREILPTQSHLDLERKETWKLMLLHGVNNVRGGPRTQLANFTLAQMEDLTTDIGHDLNMKYSDVRERLGLSPFITTSARTSAAINQNAAGMIVPHNPNKNPDVVTGGESQKTTPTSGLVVHGQTMQSKPAMSSKNQPPAQATKPMMTTKQSKLKQYVQTWMQNNSRIDMNNNSSKRQKYHQRYSNTRYDEFDDEEDYSDDDDGDEEDPFTVCAKCGDEKFPDPEKPLCRRCWSKRESQGSFNNCFICHRRTNGDPTRPLCYSCYKTWEKRMVLLKFILDVMSLLYYLLRLNARTLCEKRLSLVIF